MNELDEKAAIGFLAFGAMLGALLCGALLSDLSGARHAAGMTGLEECRSFCGERGVAQWSTPYGTCRCEAKR